MVGPPKSRPPMSHRKSDLGIPCPRKICQSSASQSSIRRFIGDMRGDDAPALRHTYPSLALPPRAVGPRPFGFGIADREVATKGCDVRVQNGVLNTFDIACPPECRDGGVPD